MTAVLAAILAAALAPSPGPPPAADRAERRIATEHGASAGPQGNRAAQDLRFEPPVPEQTVDPVVSPLTWRGGTVVLRVRVAKDGSVADVDVLQSFPALTDAAVKAVEQWRFAPARLGGRPVEATTTVVVHVTIVRTVTPR
ncbi:MAG TPA: energy transducer TonB [Vicinamibacterales bacterium]|nr:energy transducer TonB [Vicinamibacterales bacterium]